MSISDNLKRIYDQISDAGCAPEKVSIVGAAKYQPVDRVREAIQGGIKILGDNQLQFGEKLRAELKEENVEWHFIGHIQSRKAKGLANYNCIQSIERIKVASTLNAALQTQGTPIDVLVQVNIGQEATKSGISPPELDDFLKQLEPLEFLRVKGLMCLPPPLNPIEKRRPFFAQMKKLQEKFGFSVLSMGTSDDFAIALQEGSTMIRLGTCLFGERVR